MCGLTGVWGPPGAASELEARVSRMTATLVHRGPDAGGVFVHAESGIALGHRRLSIVDLTAAGAQPMRSRSGRFVTAYNGEIYNFRALRAELEQHGHAFRGGSDTEVALAAFEEWGLERALGRFVGMFAFALWDAQARELHLVRDRLGVKPLSWGRAGGAILWASELRALRADPAFDARLDREALAAYLRRSAIPAPHTIHATARKVRPGTFLTFRRPDGEPTETVYWSAREVAARGLRDRFRGTEDEAIDAVEELLSDAVSLRLVADVPIGAFLSGGIDSSLVVALMQRAAGGRVRTYSIGNELRDYDESSSARRVAQHLGTDHTAHTVSAKEALAIITDMPAMFDEPFGDSSRIPTFLVSRLARRDVTVALSGDGGDELFGGYNRHVWGPRIWRRMERVPRGVRAWVARRIAAISAERWGAILERTPGVAGRVRLPGQQMHKLARVLPAASVSALYLSLSSHFDAPTSIALGARSEAALGDFEFDLPGADAAERMMFADLVTYLPDDILTKVDRASMAVSLEAREPLLDHRLVELAWRLPSAMRASARGGKWILRRVLARHVPPELFERPKMGFGVPIGEWLRGPLRAWADALLDRRRLEEEGLLAPEPILALWHAHLRGEGNHQHHLWDVLSFQRWLEATRGGGEPIAAEAA